ncbi:MAG: hypothetical protein JWM52_493 [Candidatus Saccharibacteria bacterium]|nr:hypothetical protein [Candidatus Saccharibacteria bacterium]
MLGPLLVESDAFHLLALNMCQRVPIPDWRYPVRATPHGLLGDALPRLLTEVASVELGHTSEDVVHQHARWSFTNLLGDRDQSGSGGPDLGEDHDVVGTISRQPVELVHDDIVDAALTHIGEQRLQPRPICRACRSPGVDKLTDDLTTEIGHLALTGSALRWDGIPLGLAVSGGLTRGGDAQIDHGALGLVSGDLG